MIVAGSVMLAALVMLEMDRHFGGVFFDAGAGGAPILYQHLSWIFFTISLKTSVIDSIYPIFTVYRLIIWI